MMRSLIWILLCYLWTIFSVAYAVEQGSYSLSLLKEKIRFALIEKGACKTSTSPDQCKIILPGHGRDIILPNLRGDIALEIKNMHVTVSSKQFNAVLQFQDNSALTHTIPVRGRFEEFVLVPVLSHRVKAGDTIHAEDIQMLPVNTASLRHHVITDSNMLIGKIAKRTLSAHTILSKTDLTASATIRRNAAVTMVYQNAALTIKDLGIALEEGAAGDVIKVKNARSNVIVQGTIREEGIVLISPASHSTVAKGSTYVQ